MTKANTAKTPRLCSVPDCGRAHSARSYCIEHYSKFRRYGDPCYVARRADQAECSVEGCERYSKVRGWCQAHYSRWLRKGEVGGPFRTGKPRREQCTHPGCGRPYHARGYCEQHYARLRSTGTSEARGGREDCSVEGCYRAHGSNGYCRMHQMRLHKYGESGLSQEGRPNLRGVNGYVTLRVDGRVVYEHRWVMERILGRPLHSDETVHHINGDRQDNRPENLEVWSSSQPPGQRVQDKVEWATEMLRRYAPERLADPTCEVPA